MVQRVNTLLTMSDIAALAQVQRPVVTMWTRRYTGSDRPFPAPSQIRGRQRHYDGDEVVRWIESRNLGNNDALDESLALHAALNTGDEFDEDIVFDGITALLCLKWYLGGQLSEYSSAELLDEADETDPDDEFLYSEIETLGDGLTKFAEYTDLLADSAYEPKFAFESLVAQRNRSTISSDSGGRVSPQCLTLCAAITAALTDPDHHVYVDPTAGTSDLLVAVRAGLPEYSEPTSMCNETGSRTSRLARRRLAVHGWARASPPRGGFGTGFELSGPSAFVIQYPSASSLGHTDAQILSEIDDIAVQMSDDHVAVVLAPASALLDAQPDPEAARLRSDILRSDRVRAAIRLPEGLMPASPGTSLALWVLGPASEAVRPADRWSVIVDVGSRELDDATTDGLVSDVVAAMGDWNSIRAHAFQFGVLTKTSVLLAEDKRGLTPTRIKRPRVRRIGADLAAEILTRSDAIQHTQLELRRDVRLPVEYRAADGSLLPTLGQLAASGELKVLGGHRIEPGHILAGGAVRVIGLEEVLGQIGIGQRGVDRLLFTAAYPSARYTEPGDIVFTSGARFGAVVDHDGSSVAVFPARIIRIADATSSGLIPDVIAGHLNASGLGSRPPRAIRSSATWKRWEVPRVPPETAAATIDAVDSLRRHRATAAQLLAEIEQLTSTLVDGLAHGVLTVSDGSRAPQERSAQNAS
ncbi:helix-turn-helix transcriptional regulator [Rhodococcoides yunnanense]|uniref:helix-turn-helix transcriptional regulator n=1 Tax=Rhodococcoides yunnanense TaxID=278209 RepID=UPI000A0426C7|nr:hypothetical protein [Rhodococcus yunnanensis]